MDKLMKELERIRNKMVSKQQLAGRQLNTASKILSIAKYGTVQEAIKAIVKVELLHHNAIELIKQYKRLEVKTAVLNTWINAKGLGIELIYTNKRINNRLNFRF